MVKLQLKLLVVAKIENKNLCDLCQIKEIPKGMTGDTNVNGVTLKSLRCQNNYKRKRNLLDQLKMEQDIMIALLIWWALGQR